MMKPPAVRERAQISTLFSPVAVRPRCLHIDDVPMCACVCAYKYKWQRLIACLIVSRLIVHTSSDYGCPNAAGECICELYCFADAKTGVHEDECTSRT